MLTYERSILLMGVRIESRSVIAFRFSPANSGAGISSRSYLVRKLFLFVFIAPLFQINND